MSGALFFQATGLSIFFDGVLVGMSFHHYGMFWLGLQSDNPAFHVCEHTYVMPYFDVSMRHDIVIVCMRMLCHPAASVAEGPARSSDLLVVQAVSIADVPGCFSAIYSPEGCKHSIIHNVIHVMPYLEICMCHPAAADVEVPSFNSVRPVVQTLCMLWIGLQSDNPAFHVCVHTCVRPYSDISMRRDIVIVYMRIYAVLLLHSQKCQLLALVF